MDFYTISIYYAKPCDVKKIINNELVVNYSISDEDYNGLIKIIATIKG